MVLSFLSLVALLVYIFQKHNGRLPKPEADDLNLLISAITKEFNAVMGKGDNVSFRFLV